MNKKLFPVIVAIVMALTLVFAPFTGAVTEAYAGTHPTAIVTVDGRLVRFEDQPAIIIPPGHVLVPVRGAFEEMGFTVTWDSANRMALLPRHDVVIVIPADLDSFVVNNVVITPRVPQRIMNGRLMLPLRYIAESAFGRAEWDNVNRIAMICTQGHAAPDPPPPPPPTPQPPTPPPQPPGGARTALFTARPWDHTVRHNITRTNTNVAGIPRTGILTRAFGAAEQRHEDSWIDIDLTGLNARRFIGYVSRTGAIDMPGASARVATIFGDGAVLASFTVGEHAVVTPFDVDVSGITTLRIHFQAIGPEHENGVSLTAFGLYLQS